jgi:prevent-host-death family protein
VTRVYSTYEAKSRFSELLRQVREGQSVTISYHGKPVAELRPIERAETQEEALDRLERRGVLVRPRNLKLDLRPVAKRPGALKRFLESRD